MEYVFYRRDTEKRKLPKAAIIGKALFERKA